MSGVRVEIAGGIGRIVLERPPLNVVDLALAGELREAAEGLARHPDLRVVVIAARGRAFSAGVDVRDHLPDRGATMIHEFHRACRAVHDLPAPVVCAVHGAALGGGAELTLACDVVVAAERATFGFPEIRLGVFAPLASVALASRVPAAVASDLLLSGRTMDAREAQAIGLASRVLPDAEFEAGVGEIVAELAARSREALRAAKAAMRLRGAIDFAAVDAAERLYMEHRLEAPDAIEGLTAFLEKRPPRWY